MNIAIIGTGNFGANLGIRLTEVGHDVVFGVRRGKDLTNFSASAVAAPGRPASFHVR